MTPRPDEGRDARSMRPMPLLTLLGWAIVGGVLGWAVHPVVERFGGRPPLVPWAQPATLLLLAAILGYVAWATHRALHVRRERLEPHQALNRFLIGRASALVAALVAGGYLGYGLTWVGDPAALATERLVGSLAAAGCAVAATVAAVLLERACRVPGDDDDDTSDATA